MSDNKPTPQSDAQREELRNMARRAEDISDRLNKHGIIFGIHYKHNAVQPDGSTADGLGVSRSIGAEVALMEMMADWYDAKAKAIEEGVTGRFMEEVLSMQGGESN